MSLLLCFLIHSSSATPVTFRPIPAASGGVEASSPAAPPHSQKKLAPPAVRALEPHTVQHTEPSIIAFVAGRSAGTDESTVEDFRDPTDRAHVA